MVQSDENLRSAGRRPGLLLRGAPSSKVFCERPLGRYHAGRSWLLGYSPDGAFSVLSAWGRPTEDDAQEFLRVSEGVRRWHGQQPHALLIDTRALSLIDPFAFGVFAGFLGTARTSLERAIVRVAVLLGTGVSAAVAAGLIRLIPFNRPVDSFRSAEDATRWLACGCGPDVVEEIDRLQAAARQVSPDLLRLTRYLEGHPRASLRECASALATSERTLQRQLADGRTTFYRELRRVRVEIAKRLLTESDACLERVASAAGCSSSQQLSVLFRELVGDSPGAWRQRASSGAISRVGRAALAF